jgi:hypothetical protein
LVGTGVGLAALGGGLATFRGTSTPVSASQPEVVTHDFGTARDGDYIDFAFPVVNRGSAELVISSLTPSCTCTVLGAEPRFIPARGSISMPVRVHVVGDGPFESYVTIELKEHVPKVLRVKGTVVAQHPAFVAFGDLRRSSRQEHVFYLRSASGKRLHVSSVNHGSACDVVVGYDTPDSIDPRVTLVATCKSSGAFSDLVTFETDDERDHQMLVRVEGYVLGEMETWPRVMSFGAVASGGKKTVLLRLTSPYGDVVRIEGVTSSSPSLSFGDHVHEELTGAHPIDVPVTVTGSFPGEVLKATIDIHAVTGARPIARSIEVYALKL